MKRLLLALLLALPASATTITSAECERGAEIIRNQTGCELASPHLSAYASGNTFLHGNTWVGTTWASALVFPGLERGHARARAEITGTGSTPGPVRPGFITISGHEMTATLGGDERYSLGFDIGGLTTFGTHPFVLGVMFPVRVWSAAEAHGLGGLGVSTDVRLTAEGISVAAPEPVTLVLVGSALLLLFRRRRG